MSFGRGRPKDERYERRPLAPTNGNGAEMHRAPANEFHRNEHTENYYANASYGSDMNNMNNYRSNYYQPPSRYDHPKNTSYEHRPLSSLQVFKPNPTQHNSTHLFNSTHTTHELIQIAFSNLATLKPSLTAAFWNKVSKQMSGRNASNPRLPRHNDELDDHLNQIFEHTTRTLSLFSMRDLTQTIYSMSKLADVLRTRGRRWGEDIIDVLNRLLLNHDKTPKKELFLSFAIASRDKLDHYDARCLSNVAYAYALIGYVPEFDDGSNLFDHIATQATQRSAEFNAQGISNMMWAYATVVKPYAILFEVMGDQVVSCEHLGEFKPQEISNTVWAYAKAGISHPKLFEKIANHIVSFGNLARFNSQDLSNTMWAYAKAGSNHPELFEKMANHIVESDSLDRFIPQELSNLAWAYATAQFPHPKLFEKMANHVARLDVLYGFEPQALSNIVWAYAKAVVSHPKLFEKVANHIVSFGYLSRFDPQAFSITLWAYAKAGFNHPELFEKVANCIIASDNLDRFNSQDLSNIMWAYATAGINHPKLFEKVANLIVEHDSLDRFIPQELAITVWAYAKAGIGHSKLFEKVANHIVESDRLDRFVPQTLSKTLWAYAKAGSNHPELFEKIASHIVSLDNFDRFDPQDLSSTIWAYATAQFPHPKLFKKVAEAAIRCKGGFNFQEVANLLWAYATMGIVDKQLFLSFMPAAAELIDIDSCDNQGLANIAWAYAVANVDGPTLFNAHFINKCVEKECEIGIKELSQLYQWHLWQTKEKSNPGLPIDLQERCHDIFISEEPTISKFQNDVVAQLSHIGLDPTEEVLMNSGYRIDALVEVSGKTIGVEVDGPFHFIGKGKCPLARTILKRRQVPLIDGIELVAVPYWEWNRLGKDELKTHEYLRRLVGL